MRTRLRNKRYPIFTYISGHRGVLYIHGDLPGGVSAANGVLACGILQRIVQTVAMTANAHRCQMRKCKSAAITYCCDPLE